jgi:hypothetical protein
VLVLFYFIFILKFHFIFFRKPEIICLMTEPSAPFLDDCHFEAAQSSTSTLRAPTHPVFNSPELLMTHLHPRGGCNTNALLFLVGIHLCESDLA